MLMGRIGRPGLIGLAARTAIVAGTATATVGALSRHQARKARESYEAEQYENSEQGATAQQYGFTEPAYATEPPRPQPSARVPAQAAEPSPGGGSGDVVDRIKELSDLHAQGALTDDEFTTAKAQVLGA
jgi:hypothetical protein